MHNAYQVMRSATQEKNRKKLAAEFIERDEQAKESPSQPAHHIACRCGAIQCTAWRVSREGEAPYVMERDQQRRVQLVVKQAVQLALLEVA